VRKSCPAALHVRSSGLPPKPPPIFSPSPLPALRSPAPHMRLPPAPAMPSDPTSRCLSAAATRAAHTPPAPYTPATSLQGVSVTSPHPNSPRFLPHFPPA